MSGSRAGPVGRAGWPSTWTVVGGRRPVGLAEACVPVRRREEAVTMQLPSSVRQLGLDLGVTSEHAAVVLDAAAGVRARRRARPTLDSLTALEAAALLTRRPGSLQ